MPFDPAANLALIGLRCSGKSTVGPRVAAELATDFVDLDNITAAELGFPTAGDALRALGEPSFRAGELHALVKTLHRPSRVIAFGGGTPMTCDAMDVILHERNAGRLAIVYLRASVPVLVARMTDGGTHTRPSLTGLPLADEVAALFEDRDEIYSHIAHRVIEIDRLAPEHAAVAIASWFQANQALKPA